MNQVIRDFFRVRGVLEVETPALSVSANTDPAITSFSVNTPQGLRYLHTSPEYPMKRLLAAGSGDIFQICKVWRQDEAGRCHNPEFTLLEYYRVGFSWQSLMQEVAELLQCLLPSLQAPRFISYRDCFLETLQIDPHAASEAELSAVAQQQGIDIETLGDLDRQAWCDLLFTHCIESCLPVDSLSFVYHYPAQQSALAQVVYTQEQDQPVAERFEVYWGALELGNAYQELTDAAANRAKLQADALLQSESMPLDELFLAAMAHGMPKTAGVAIGLDRVLMCRLGENFLHRVLSFAWDAA